MREPRGEDENISSLERDRGPLELGLLRIGEPSVGGVLREQSSFVLPDGHLEAAVLESRRIDGNVNGEVVLLPKGRECRSILCARGKLLVSSRGLVSVHNGSRTHDAGEIHLLQEACS